MFQFAKESALNRYVLEAPPFAIQITKKRNKL